MRINPPLLPEFARLLGEIDLYLCLFMCAFASFSQLWAVILVVFQRYQLKISALICAASMACCANICQADKSIFCGAADQLKKIQFIPIRQMDNEMLMESVANTLDNSMSSEVRLMNNYWLNSNKENTRLNQAAIGRVLAVTLGTYYDLAVQSLIPGEPDKHAKEHTALVGMWGNYHLRVSKSSAQVGWNFRF